ncbi:MAG: 3'(2'),5'-bisphosphate nucleotidase CysQ [Brevundimonas sp.]|nr:MAG: 3'(2'),5'-bisphosphate nucleotidase CysQ [Brevundimonas sp.]
MHERVENDRLSGVLTDRLAEVAEAASALILPFWRNGVAAMTKADASPVTEADQQAEALILSMLQDVYPEVPAVAEEMSAADGLPDQAPDRFWLIDPLDGTKGFIAGKEHFTVNIALIDHGQVVAGVVAAPALSMTWTGVAGQGARRRRFGQGWQTIQVRPASEPAHALLSHSMKDQAAYDLARAHGCADWTGMDSSIKFCLIAQGDYDSYPRTGPTHEWDTAAGQAVLQAAGGQVLGPDGRTLGYGKPRFLNGPFVARGG